MKLLVTGANGFLGRYVVADALRRGHAVRALVRSAGDAARHGWDREPLVQVAVADLRSRRGLADVVRGVDAVLHLAAAKSGDLFTQMAGTVVATENLLAAMTEAGVRRIVLVSSFAIYDYMKMRQFATVDESSPVIPDYSDRDEYAHTKLLQEQVVREYAPKHGIDFTVLRPGVIFGPDNLWSARLGTQGKDTWVRMGAWARLPLTYVENVADAVVRAAEVDAAKGQILNVIDDEMPSQRLYVEMLQVRTTPAPRVVPVSWTAMRVLAATASTANKLIFKGKAKLPGFLIPSRLHARAKPLNYSNSKIKQVLGWRPRFTLIQALDRSFAKTTSQSTIPAQDPAAKQRLSPGSTDLISVGSNRPSGA